MKNLFRKEALDNFDIHETKYKSVHAVKIHSLVWILLLVICVALFGYWLLFGTVNETLSVQCVVWPFMKANSVYATVSGEIAQTLVYEGNFVKAGDVLAVIPQEAYLSGIDYERANADGNSDDSEFFISKYRSTSLIRAQSDGLVTYIADENSFAEPGTLIAVITPFDQNSHEYKLTSYIPSNKIDLVSLGMEVQVTPEYLTRTENGFIHGYVSDISQVSVKGEDIRKQDTVLFSSDIRAEENYNKIEITLLPDSTHPTNYKWSRPESSHIRLNIGTVCNGDILISKSNPLNWLF